MTFRSGRTLIVAMLALGLAAATAAMAYRYFLTRRALSFYGSEAAVLILRSPTVVALEFDPPLAESGSRDATALEVTARRRHDASVARGMINVRQALVEDSTFDWDRTISQPPHTWRYGLRFTDQDRSTVLLFDPATALIESPLGGQIAALDPNGNYELERFLQEQFDHPAP